MVYAVTASEQATRSSVVRDCYRERVTVCIANGDCFIFLGDRCDKSLPSSYNPRSQGQFNFLLATLWEDGNDVVRNEFRRVVCEYLDVFLEDLTELPPRRDVEFTIDLLSGMTPISLSPYRFALAELVVLKEQLQELLMSGDGVMVDSSKMEAVLGWEQPKNASKIRSFLGLAGYYR
ncbi:hypothetical protein ACSBR1_003536 [Camellia fascicularis]